MPAKRMLLKTSIYLDWRGYLQFDSFPDNGNIIDESCRLDKLVNEPIEGNAWHADHIVPVYKGGGMKANHILIIV